MTSVDDVSTAPRPEAAATSTFPSETFPDWPRVSLDAPAGWAPVAAPDALIALRAGEPSPSGFSTNLVVTVTRFSAEYTLTQAVADLERKIVRLRNSQVITAGTVELGGVPAHRRDVAFAHPQVGRIRQLHVLAVLDRGRVRDLVHVTGSCADGEAGEVIAIAAAAASVRLAVR